MSGDKEILALEDERYAAMCSGDFAALEASAISREPERLRDAQDAINGGYCQSCRPCRSSARLINLQKACGSAT